MGVAFGQARRNAPTLGRTLGGVQEHSRAGKFWPRALGKEKKSWAGSGQGLDRSLARRSPASRGGGSLRAFRQAIGMNGTVLYIGGVCKGTFVFAAMFGTNHAKIILCGAEMSRR